MKWTKPTHFGVDWEHKGTHSETDRSLAPGNSMPVPYREISLEEYLRLAFCQPWGPTGEGNFRQVLDLEGLTMWTLHIQHYNDYSLAVAEQYSRKEKRDERKPAFEVKTRHGVYFLRFFVLGCKHEYREVSHDFARKELGVSTWGMHCHVHYCKKCEHHYSVDSSG